MNHLYLRTDGQHEMSTDTSIVLKPQHRRQINKQPIYLLNDLYKGTPATFNIEVVVS